MYEIPSKLKAWLAVSVERGQKPHPPDSTKPRPDPIDAQWQARDKEQALRQSMRDNLHLDGNFVFPRGR